MKHIYLVLAVFFTASVPCGLMAQSAAVCNDASTMLIYDAQNVDIDGAGTYDYAIGTNDCDAELAVNIVVTTNVSGNEIGIRTDSDLDNGNLGVLQLWFDPQPASGNPSSNNPGNGPGMGADGRLYF